MSKIRQRFGGHAGRLVAAAGGGDPAPKPLTPDEDKQFKQQRTNDRQTEKPEQPRSTVDSPLGRLPFITPLAWQMAALVN